MPDITEQTPATVQQTPPPPPPAAPVSSKASKEKKRKRRRAVKIIVGLVILAAVIAAVVFLMMTFVFKKEEKGEIMTAVATRSSIQSVVEGSGNTKAKDSATITPEAGGTILELFVKEGDYVTEGQQLYRMDDTEAQQAVQKARDNVNDYQKQLDDINDSYKDLTIAAPFSGKMVDVNEKLQLGDDATVGTKVATIVDDTKLKLSLYFSYAFQDMIHEGQAAQISIPSTMAILDGVVEKINYVSFITPEGSVCFEVVLSVKNPSTLTQGMEATATLTDPDGGAIYPYQNDQLEYYQTKELTVKVAGPVEMVNLLNYANVQAGQVLVQLGAKNNDKEISDINESMKTAQKALDDALEKLGTFNAVAPISGTVISCPLSEGMKVEANQGISIADTSVMTVEIQVDERNINDVKPGMAVQLSRYNENFYTGIVESVSQNANAQNGVATFPVVVKVDNSDGALMSNMYLQYSFVANQSDNCLVVPVQAVKYVSFTNTAPPEGTEPLEGEADAGIPEVEAAGMAGGGAGYTAQNLGAVAIPVPAGGSSSSSMGGGPGGDTGTVCFVQAETPPENAVPADPAWEVPEGFYPVVVEVGLADTINVEIKTGLNDGDVVFVGYEKQQADNYGM